MSGARAGVRVQERRRDAARGRSRQSYAQTQARRYEKLLLLRSISEEAVTMKRQELQIADAMLSAAREEVDRAALSVRH